MSLRISLFAILALWSANFAQAQPLPSLDDRSGGLKKGYTVIGLPDSQTLVITKLWASLDSYRNSSQTARRFLEFFERNAIPLPWGIAHLVIPRIQVSDSAFFITVNPAPADSDTFFVAARFQSSNRRLEVLNMRNGQLVMAAQTVHELNHVWTATYDSTVADTGLFRWLTSEALAHNAAYHFLKEVTKGKWLKLVIASQQVRDSTMKAQGVDPAQSFSFGAAAGDEARIRSFFGELSDPDLGWLELQLTIDANMYGIMQHSPPNDPDIGPKQYRFLEYFYQKTYWHPKNP